MGHVNEVYLSGRFLPETEANISATDRGFLYADGLFETFRLHGGRPYLYSRHMERLAASAAWLGIPLPEGDLEAAMCELATRNSHSEAAARLTLTRGTLPRGPRPTVGGAAPGAPTVLIQTRPLPPELDRRATEGISAKTLPWPLRAEGLPLQGHKTLAYLASVLALGHVSAGEEPVLETVGGALSESATANLFWVHSGVLYTPGLATGCLPGIVRRIIIEFAQTEGIKTFEGNYPRAALIEADEAFLTNSVSGIVPLVYFDDHEIGDGAPGTLTRLLRGHYEDAVRSWLETRPS